MPKTMTAVEQLGLAAQIEALIPVSAVGDAHDGSDLAAAWACIRDAAAAVRAGDYWLAASHVFHLIEMARAALKPAPVFSAAAEPARGKWADLLAQALALLAKLAPLFV